MIYRVLVLLFAIVVIAAGTERVYAEVSSDPMADILADEAVIHVAQTEPQPSLPSIEQTSGPLAVIAPAPALMRVFRPPRAMRS